MQSFFVEINHDLNDKIALLISHLARHLKRLFNLIHAVISLGHQAAHVRHVCRRVGKELDDLLNGSSHADDHDFASRLGGVDCSLHTCFHTSAFVDCCDLTNGLPIDLGLLDHSSDLLSKGKLVLNGLWALHGDEHRSIGETVASSKVKTVLQDIGNDNSLGLIGLGNSSCEKPDGAGAENENG
ncbi:hypothetical protein HG530_001846 [Fusarium avenaceum]|nr:hypothetical protein HG530_001846 [Fusarium avenaceum]